MHLRQLLQSLILIPSEQEIDVLVRTNDALAKVENVHLFEKNGKLTVELSAKSLSVRSPVKTVPQLQKSPGNSGFVRTINNRAEIEKLTGRRIHTRTA